MYRYITVFALSFVLSQVPISGAEQFDPKPMTDLSGEYLLFGTSMFDYSTGTNAYPSGGVPVTTPVNIEFGENGNVKFENLFGQFGDFAPITGKYDETGRKVDFETPAKEFQNPKKYISIGHGEDYETFFCALNPYGFGNVEHLTGLSLKFSEDYRSLYPSSGFGAGMAYMIDKNLYQVAGYDAVIYDALLLKKEEGISFNIDHRKTDIANCYPGEKTSTVFTIFNTGDEPSEYVIGSTSSHFKVCNPAGVLSPGTFVDINVEFSADETGEYIGTVIITNEEEDLDFDVKATCVPVPDYAQIVKNGELKFSTNAKFPWVLSDKYGTDVVAVSGNAGQEKTTSSLYADINVSEKHAGILTWEGFCDPYHPTRDVFAVIVDGKEQYMSPNGGGSTDSSVEIAPGTHTIEFAYVKGPKVTGTFATGKDVAWLKSISLDEKSLMKDNLSVNADKVTFQPKTIIKKGALDSDNIIVRNEGWGDLQLISAESDNDAFSAEFPEEAVPTFETVPVKIKFHTYTPGKHSGNVILHTTAGDVTIKCSGEAVAVPDYSPIVTKGEFDFDTTIAYPFVVDGDKAYNSTSQKKDRKATQSMLQANFEVPEGYYGELSWSARVSTSGANGDEGTDYATVYIDGEDITSDYYGEQETSQMDFSPASVNFYPGAHFVCFAYTQAGDNKYEGDDRIEVSNLSLKLKKMKEDDVKFWGTDKAMFDETRITKVYNREVKLANFGSHALQIKSFRIEGPFEAAVDCERLYNTFEEIPVEVTFVPTTAGVHEGAIVLNTTAGEMRIKCIATVVDDPETLLVEDFEDDLRLWTFIDGDGDGMTWANVLVPQNAYHGECALQSFSIHNDFTEDAIDDIALSPEFLIPECGATLQFYLACYNTSLADAVTILAGEGDNVEDYTLIKEFDLTGVKPYYNLYTCSLDELAGRKVRLAFRHKLDVSVMSFIAIDDISVKSKNAGGIHTVIGNDAEIADVEYFNLQGVRVQNPDNGIFIRQIIYADGSSARDKVIITNSNIR